LGIWQLVPDSGVNTDENYIWGYVDHLSQYGVFGSALPVAPGAGGGIALAVTPVALEGLSATARLRVDSKGIVQTATQLKTADAVATLDIPAGTAILDAQGQPLASLQAVEIPEPPAPPSGSAIVLAYDFGPDETTFNPPITLTMSYDPAELPEGVSEGDLYIVYWDGSQWVTLESTVDTAANTVSAEVAHFTEFAVMGKLPAPPTPPPTPAPAKFAIASISVSPSEVKVGEQVAISAVVTNSGGSEGTYTVVLKLDGVEKAKKQVTLGAGKSETLTFAVSGDKEGSYTVSIEDKSGKFTVAAVPVAPPPVTPPPPPVTTPEEVFSWAIFWGVLAAVIVVGVAVWLALRRRARQA
jgi:hypothetical protein